MQPEELARLCKALADPTRAKIFQFLACCQERVALDDDGTVRPVCGPTVGEVCCEVTGIDRVTSTISFHLKELREAGLITMDRRGQHMLCAIRGEVVARLAEHLTQISTSCCSGPNGEKP